MMGKLGRTLIWHHSKTNKLETTRTHAILYTGMCRWTDRVIKGVEEGSEAKQLQANRHETNTDTHRDRPGIESQRG